MRNAFAHYRSTWKKTHMNKSSVKHAPPSFALVVVLGLALSGYTPMTMLAILTYLTWWICGEIYGRRATTAVPSKSDRLEEEIGITPRMIEAGALELMEFDGKVSSFEDGALNIYRVMLRAKTATPLERALLSRKKQANR